MFPCINTGIMSVFPGYFHCVITNRFCFFNKISFFRNRRLINRNIFMKKYLLPLAACTWAVITQLLRRQISFSSVAECKMICKSLRVFFELGKMQGQFNSFPSFFVLASMLSVLFLHPILFPASGPSCINTIFPLYSISYMDIHCRNNFRQVEQE